MKAAMDKITFYISPELYHAEKAYIKTGKLPGQRMNIEHERQSRSAHRTGRPDSSPLMKKVISKLYKDGKRVYSKDAVYLEGDQGIPVSTTIRVKESDDDAVLGD